MMRVAMLTVLFVAGCSGKDTTPPAQDGVSSFTSVDIRPGDRGTTVTFDTGAMRGIVEVEPGLATSYEVRTKSGGESEPVTTTALIVAGHEMRLDGSKLRIGDRVVGPLSGEVRVEVKRDGIYVDGKKKSDF